MPLSIDDRVRRLEQWRHDVAHELREWEEWRDLVKPFIESLQADLVYRQRRFSERTRSARLVTWGIGVVVGGAAVGSFILQLVHAIGGHR